MIARGQSSHVSMRSAQGPNIYETQGLSQYATIEYRRYNTDVYTHYNTTYRVRHPRTEVCG